MLSRVEHIALSQRSAQAYFATPVSGATRRFRLCLAVAILDVAAITLALAVASFVRLDDPWPGLHLAGIGLPLYGAIALTNGAFAHRRIVAARGGLRRALLALAFSAGAIVLVAFSLQASETLSRTIMGAGFAGAALLLATARIAVDALSRRAGGGMVSRMLVIRDGVEVRSAAGAHLIDAAALGLAHDDPDARDRLGKLARVADRIVVACPPERRAAWAETLRGCAASCELLLPDYDALGALGLRRHHGVTTLQVSAGPLGLRDRALKRGFDLALGGAMLLLAAPLIALVAVAVLLDSGRPIFFSQRRIGRDNCHFRILKFRTMHHAERDAVGARSVAAGDARVTRIGRLLRATSLDELPQLFNVLGGSMSLIGPRPHALASTAGGQLFWIIDRRYWERHTLKPGLTGLAQVRGLRGETATEGDLTDRLRADLEYLARWSLWLDVLILLRTLLVVVHRRAY